MKVQASSHPPISSQPGSRTAALAEALRYRILSMELAPGVVVDELRLCEEFGLSRPPVRELLRQMAAEGFVELETNRAPRVTAMGHETIHSFFLVAPLIYCAMAQLAAKRASNPEIEVLRGILVDLRRAVAANDYMRKIFLSNELHVQIGQIASNHHLMPSLRRLLIDHTRLNKFFYSHPSVDGGEDMKLACDQHELVIDALEARDPAKAGEAARAHLELSRQRMVDFTSPFPIEVALVC
ncbi:GntR family transcriptional regulator [Pseudomonas sp. WHRI 8519]|uniref:GntR family transcriptional regulator n=1 Tax=Pseudomonas sp. WHRI 8519 TaxID=3162567 RepID=UPI0032EB9CD3